MISDGLNGFKGKRVLMLQGPVGPFFARFAADMNLAGAAVFKVNFNGGDWLFSKSAAFVKCFNFSAGPDAWPPYLNDLLERLNIDTVFLFGDCRQLHVTAIAVCQSRRITVGVFEEGYLRPDYITLERDGVNNHSALPTNPNFYLGQPERQAPTRLALGSTYWHAAQWGMLYFAAATLGQFKFWRYQHHRRLGISDAHTWWISYGRKFFYRWREAPLMPLLVTTHAGQFFLVSLQTRGDAQMSVHSAYESVEQFIEHTVRSFAAHAPAATMLALKHHPLDRGYSDYTRLIRQLVKQHQLEGRCFYIHDQHLPTLLQYARGMVVVNSTTGLSAVGEGVPTKVCGRSVYDIQGLTFQGSLDDFWKNAHLAVPNPALYTAFRHYLIAHTQHHGSFYRRLPGVAYRSGVLWADHGFEASHHGSLPDLPHHPPGAPPESRAAQWAQRPPRQP